MTWLLIILLYGQRIDVIQIQTYEACINRSALVVHDMEVRMAVCIRDNGRDA